jgi:hypothetical protein
MKNILSPSNTISSHRQKNEMGLVFFFVVVARCQIKAMQTVLVNYVKLSFVKFIFWNFRGISELTTDSF